MKEYICYINRYVLARLYCQIYCNCVYGHEMLTQNLFFFIEELFIVIPLLIGQVCTALEVLIQPLIQT